jgi:hypothetical protein
MAVVDRIEDRSSLAATPHPLGQRNGRRRVLGTHSILHGIGPEGVAAMGL